MRATSVFFFWLLLLFLLTGCGARSASPRSANARSERGRSIALRFRLPRPSPTPPLQKIPLPARGASHADTAVTPTRPTPETLEIEGRHGNVISHCLGVLIAPRVALTAAHCVHDAASVSADLYLTPRGAIAATRLWLDGNADHSDGFVDLDNSDVAVLELAKPIVLPAFPDIARRTLLSGTRVMGVTRTARGLQAMSFTLTRPGDAPAHYAGAPYTKAGDSGGPVYAGTDETRFVVGIVAGGGDSRTLYARVDATAGSIDRILARVDREEKNRMESRGKSARSAKVTAP